MSELQHSPGGCYKSDSIAATKYWMKHEDVLKKRHGKWWFENVWPKLKESWGK